MFRVFRSAVLVLATAACSPAAPAPTPSTQAEAHAQEEAHIQEEAHRAHDAYVAAINSNDAAKLMSVLTDDIVYMSPHEPVIVGKDAVRKWVEGYFGAYSTRWEKTSDEFVVSGDWAIERYSYRVTDSPREGGAPATDTGKGINIYHHDSDGTWRVARDAWNSDLPASK